MNETPLTVAVVVAGTRRGRFGPAIADWYRGEVASRDDVAVDVVDLVRAGLSPDTAAVPGPGPEVVDPAPRLAAADAFVVVTPEHHSSYPALLEIAIEAYAEHWRAKPVALVSYGGAAGGIRAAEHLRQVFPEVHAMTVRDAVRFHDCPQRFGLDGSPRDVLECANAAKSMTDQLVWWGRALRTARAALPYA